MKIEPVITDLGILSKNKASIPFYSMEMKYEDYTLVLNTDINNDCFSTKRIDYFENTKRSTFYFHDTLFFKCYDIDFSPIKANIQYLFYKNISSKLTKEIINKRKTRYIHYTLITSAYMFEIVCDNHLLEIYNKENNFDINYDENNWITFSDQYKDYHSNNINELSSEFGFDNRLATVIDKVIGKNSNEWIFKKLPELNNLSPIECKKNIKLRNKLKVMLMRI